MHSCAIGLDKRCRAATHFPSRLKIHWNRNWNWDRIYVYAWRNSTEWREYSVCMYYKLEWKEETQIPQNDWIRIVSAVNRNQTIISALALCVCAEHWTECGECFCDWMLALLSHSTLLCQRQHSEEYRVVNIEMKSLIDETHERNWLAKLENFSILENSLCPIRRFGVWCDTFSAIVQCIYMCIILICFLAAAMLNRILLWPSLRCRCATSEKLKKAHIILFIIWFVGNFHSAAIASSMSYHSQHTHTHTHTPIWHGHEWTTKMLLY